jgi:hypothetical protein
MIDKLKAAQQHIKLWTKIYNKLCRKCQVDLVTKTRSPEQAGTEGAIESSKKAIDSFCPKCKKMIDKTLERAKK